MIHLLVIPDDVILPASIHQFLIVNRENGEPGRVFLMRGYRETKPNNGNTENAKIA